MYDSKETVIKPMTSYALTLIGNKTSSPLERAHVTQVFQNLGLVGKEVWLAENEACDLIIETTSGADHLSKRALEVLSGHKIDVVCTPLRNRQKRLLICDMDSTMINQECIDELGDSIGVGQQIRAITSAVVNGDIGFSAALRQRMALMKGMPQSHLEKVYHDRISLKSGARTLVQTMRHHGAYCILVSGGFSYFTTRIAERIGFHDHQANELIFANGKLTGEVLEPILGRSAKLETLKNLCDSKNLTPCDVMSVGDGANDIKKMIEAAGLGVAFHATDSLKKWANASIDHHDLTALLYLQGYQKSEFIFT